LAVHASFLCENARSLCVHTCHFSNVAQTDLVLFVAEGHTWVLIELQFICNNGFTFSEGTPFYEPMVGYIHTYLFPSFLVKTKLVHTKPLEQYNHYAGEDVLTQK
jgi:hypothetical protein